MVLVAKLVFLILFEFAFCKRIENRIMDGEAATIEKFPYMASIHLKTNETLNFNSGGSIASQKVIITAAQRIVEKDTDKIFVRVGSTNQDKGGDLIGLSKVHIHPKYDMKFFVFDVAVLILKKSLTYSPKIQPISLKNLILEVPEGTLGTVSGWGSMKIGDFTPSEELKTVEVPYVPYGRCSSIYAQDGITEILENLICFGYAKNDNGQKDFCSGDSGDPIVINETLVGIASSSSCGRVFPGLYTKVSTKAVVDFIKKYVKL